MADLFDTNILIDHLRGIPEATREIERSADAAISMITWIEVMVRAASGQEAALRSFVANFVVLPVTPEVAERTVVLRRERKIKLPDAIILATAQVSGRQLVSRNTRDFPAGTPGIRVPYSI